MSQRSPDAPFETPLSPCGSKGHPSRSRWPIALVLLASITIGCTSNDPAALLGIVSTCVGDEATHAETKSSASTKRATSAKIEKLETQHLPNVVRVHGKVITGGSPVGDKAFAELKSLGVQTVISVDGAKPDVATAEKHGLRYVHLPHGYDGVPEKRAQELAKAVRDLPGQVYIHCHHGKHRSPAASAVACVSAGLIHKEDALAVLKIAGTSEHYRGLYESAKSAHPLDEALLDALQPEFPATAKLPAMAEAMVELEHAHEHLKELEKGSWKILPANPDLVPAHEALLLREHFTELLRTDEVKHQPEQFQEMMKEGERNAMDLEDALRDWSGSGNRLIPDTITSSLKKVSQNCKACHEQFRDVPLSEKTKGS